MTFSATGGVQLAYSPHVFWSQRLIIRRTWVDDLTVSLKPGVSTRTTRSPYFGCFTRTAFTWVVVASKVWPVRQLGWPVRRSINYFLLSPSQSVDLSSSHMALSSPNWANKPTCIGASVSRRKQQLVLAPDDDIIIFDHSNAIYEPGGHSKWQAILNNES